MRSYGREGVNSGNRMPGIFLLYIPKTLILRNPAMNSMHHRDYVSSLVHVQYRITKTFILDGESDLFSLYLLLFVIDNINTACSNTRTQNCLKHKYKLIPRINTEWPYILLPTW